MIRSHLCDYSDAYIHVKATLTVPSTAAQRAAVNNVNKKVILKRYNLIKYSDAYSKTLGSLWQYYRD